MAKRQGEIEKLEDEIARIAEESTISADRLERAVRQALHEARESLENAITPEQMHDFLARFVGPMLLTADGEIVQDVSTADVTDPHGAYGGNALRAVFWAHWALLRAA